MECQLFMIKNNCSSQNFNFLGKKILRMHLLQKAKSKGARWGTYILHLLLSFVYKTMSQIFLNLFCSGDKKLFSEVLQK